MAQHAVPNGMGHMEPVRAQLTAKSRRVASHPSCDAGSTGTLWRSVAGVSPT
jgi:hypothetical protein